MLVAWTSNYTSHGVHLLFHSTVCITGPSICNVFTCVYLCAYVSGQSGQFLEPKARLYVSSHLYIFILWVWVGCVGESAGLPEMRQCTIMCSPYHHGNRNGRAEEHICSRSHAQTENDETQTSTSQSHGVFNHSLNITQSPAVLQRVTLSDGHSKTGGQRHNSTNPTACKHSERQKLETSTERTTSLI